MLEAGAGLPPTQQLPLPPQGGLSLTLSFLILSERMPSGVCVCVLASCSLPIQKSHHSFPRVLPQLCRAHLENKIKNVSRGPQCLSRACGETKRSPVGDSTQMCLQSHLQKAAVPSSHFADVSPVQHCCYITLLHNPRHAFRLRWRLPRTDWLKWANSLRSVELSEGVFGSASSGWKWNLVPTPVTFLCC